MLPKRTDALVGSMLGKDYHVLKPIGAGGMAIVYLVEHQTLLKQFAAKVLSSDLASSLEARARFTQEAHAASQLDHENIVSISDFGVTADQRPFFVMELLRGQTLDQRLAEGPMTLEEIVAVSVPVARALAHAHAEGVVHLDVKPENIFLVQRSQGRWGVKVVDFGIAKTPLHPQLGKPGETIGSPMYMAPEMCRGDENIDQRADVYSFGILLYLMMCGRLPFVDDNLQRVLQMQIDQPPPPPREVNAELSPELAMVVERALAKHPDDRFPSMDAFLHDFEAALPTGADRLLIEAQSGTTVRDTPFAGTLSIGRQDSNRVARTTQPPPIAAVSSSQPLVVSSSQPATPRRRRAPLVVPIAVVATLICALVVWQLTAAPAGPSEAHEAGAAASHTATRIAAASATPHPEVASAPPPLSPTPAPAMPASADPVAAPATTGVPDPAPVGASSSTEAITEPAIEAPKTGRSIANAKKPLVRPKPTRSGRHVAAIAPTGTGPETIAPDAPPPVGASTTPLATAPAGPQPPGSRVADANAGSGALVPDGQSSGHPEASRERDATTSAPPLVTAPVKPATLVKPAVPVDHGSLDATPEVASLEVKGSLSSAIVRRSVEHTLPSLRTCYRTAARAGGATPAIELRLTFEIDENSLATQVATSGANFGSLASCAAGVASQIRTREAPDVGTAQVVVVIRFRPS